MLKDLKNNIKNEKALEAQVMTGDLNGATIDLQGYMACMFSANVGASGDTLSGSVKFELAVQESDDGSSWSAVADADISASVAGSQTGTFALIDDAAEDSLVYSVAYIGGKQYVRAIVNATGTHTNGTPLSITALKLPQVVPV